MATTKFCEGISDISDTYMGFLLDQWGVLHDGRKLYDGVLPCMEQLRSRQKKIIIVSNSSHPASHSAAKLDELGLDSSFYDHIVTSGELITHRLHDQTQGIFKNYGRKCFIFGREESSGLFADGEIEVVSNIEDADFMLIAGVDQPDIKADDYAPLLRNAVRKGVKAICTNPDSHALLGSSYLMGPGLISRMYEDFGGVVQYIGKPHAPIFRYAIELLQQYEIFPAQTVMVGDTMAHDIMGAHYVNIDTCLVKRGMHSGIFKNANTAKDVDRTLDILVNHYNHVRPRYLVDRFEWGKALPDRKHKIHKKHVRRKPPAEGEEKPEPKLRKKPTPRKPKD